MKTRALILMTLHELAARKVLWAFAIIGNSFLLIGLIISFFIPTDLASMIGGENAPELVSNEVLIPGILLGAAGFIQFAALLLGIFTTAGILPSALERGTADLMLSKPMTRGQVLFAKCAAAVLMVAANVAWFMLGAWLIVSIKFGVWNIGFLWCTAPIVFMFTVLYAPMALIGVTARSTALSIILLYVFLYLVSPILHAREMLATALGSPALEDVLSVFYYILPKPDDMGEIMSALIQGGPITWMPVWSSALFGAALYALAYLAFRRRDY